MSLVTTGPDPGWRIICADVMVGLAQLPDESVQTVVTSPPYWGLRDYGTAAWDGGDAACDHLTDNPQGGATLHATREDPASNGYRKPYRDTCGKCGAVRIDQQLGLEPTPEAYVERMVEVFREVRRVLRSDGTVWLNLGDSYATQPGKGGNVPDSKHLSNRFPAAAPHRSQNLPGLKPKDLVGIPWRVAFALQADGWWLRSDVIWCLSGGTRLYARTHRGVAPATLKDLVRLDPSTVQLWNGARWTQVLGWSSTPREETVELVLRSGERIGCTPHHEWPTQRGLVRADELTVGDRILTTTLPDAGPPAPEHLPDDLGWFVGLYLAEGSRSGSSIQIASHESELERFERTRTLAEAYGGTARMHFGPGQGASIVVESLLLGAVLRMFLGGRVAGDKHLRPACWRRGNAFLRELAIGYLNADAHYDEKNDRWRLGFTRNYALEADLRTLAARLGARIRLRPTTVRGFGKDWPAFRGEWRWDKAEASVEVMEIRRSRARRFWHVGVAETPHMFALASGVLTCNSKPNPMPESVTDRPTKSHEYVFLLSKSARYFFDADAVREAHTSNESDLRKMREGLDRIGGLVKASTDRLARASSLTNLGRKRSVGDVDAGRNLRSVWNIATEPYPEAHFATFPKALVVPCVKAGTSEKGCCPECGLAWAREVVVEPMKFRPSARQDFKRQPGNVTERGLATALNGTLEEPAKRTTTGWRPTCDHQAEPIPCTVLDPFAGSGTAGVVALRLGRSFVGIELNPEYAAMARRRIADDAPLFNVPTEVTV